MEDLNNIGQELEYDNITNNFDILMSIEEVQNQLLQKGEDLESYIEKITRVDKMQTLLLNDNLINQVKLLHQSNSRYLNEIVFYLEDDNECAIYDLLTCVVNNIQIYQPLEYLVDCTILYYNIMEFVKK